METTLVLDYIKNKLTTDYGDYADFQEYVRNTFSRACVQKW